MESVGVVGKLVHLNANNFRNNTKELPYSESNRLDAATSPKEVDKTPIRGVINDISVIERGNRGNDGLCIVAAVGAEHRLGRWMKHKARNGAVVFEVKKKILAMMSLGM